MQNQAETGSCTAPVYIQITFNGGEVRLCFWVKIIMITTISTMTHGQFGYLRGLATVSENRWVLELPLNNSKTSATDCMFVSPQNSYIETLTPNVMVFGNRRLG